jgi:DNA-binding transcriptional LysR family regulator
MVRVKPRVTMNAAVAAEGITCILLCEVDREIRDGSLLVLLPCDEPSPVLYTLSFLRVACRWRPS